METAIDSGRAQREKSGENKKLRGSESNSETPIFQVFFGDWVIL